MRATRGQMSQNSWMPLIASLRASANYSRQMLIGPFMTWRGPRRFFIPLDMSLPERLLLPVTMMTTPKMKTTKPTTAEGAMSRYPRIDNVITFGDELHDKED